MVKVLYLRSSFDPGGTESLLLNLFNYPQSEIQFHFALLKDGSLISKLNSDTNKFYKLFKTHKIDIKVLLKLVKIIHANNIGIVHTHQMIELLYAAMLKILKPRLKVFHTVHGYHDNQHRWAENLERFLIKITHKTFTVSNSSRNMLINKGYPRKRMNVLYNAVMPLQPAHESELLQMKQKINYNQNDFIIGMIGNFVWWKDQLTIVKAYNLLKEKLPSLKLVFIGKESEFSEQCKSLLTNHDIKHRVYFLGAIDNASKYLSLFDLFIMSSHKDTFGIVAIEAMMSKVPLIASDIDVMKELSKNGCYFQLFQYQNSCSLAEII